MAKRKFELPGIQELSKEQEAARARPKEGQHLVVGGPGTGKSVLALIRARRHVRERDVSAPQRALLTWVGEQLLE